MSFWSYIKDFQEGHEKLKKRIHSFRIPLSPRGQMMMKWVYFITPVIGGYYLMQWAFRQADKNIGVNGEKLRNIDHSKDHRSK
jgi:hypothetical protein